ncbi:MAG: permease-like cell division protein FtsX [Actinomycetia bacterium]|nr:permease-like cell division protein FtsX [Actinomycetes bacterium]
MRHSVREAVSSLRRNATMAVAVVVTMWVSLSLFGASLLTFQQVQLLKGTWYDKVEVSVFLCTPDTNGTMCTKGEGATDAQRAQIKAALEANPLVATVYYENKDQAWAEFQASHQGWSIVSSLGPDQMQDSFRVKLVDPRDYDKVVAQAAGLPGVQNALNLHTVFDPLFRALTALQWGAFGLAVLLLVAAVLQIGNTIRLSAYARRREIGIMRLVGASSGYITLPFLWEALVEAVLGAALAAGTLAAGVYFLIIQRAQVSIQSLAWIGWHETRQAMLAVAIVGIVLAVVPTFIATRRYLRV